MNFLLMRQISFRNPRNCPVYVEIVLGPLTYNDAKTWYLDYHIFQSVARIIENWCKYICTEHSVLYITHHNELMQKHRIDGPAEISLCYYPENVLHTYIEYFQNDIRHREDGPALIRYEDGKLLSMEYHQIINGKRQFYNGCDNDAPSMYNFGKKGVSMSWYRRLWFGMDDDNVQQHNFKRETFDYTEAIPDAEAFLRHKGISVTYKL